MKRLFAVIVALASISIGFYSPTASAAALDCSALGKYEWARFSVDGALYPGYDTSVSVSSSAYQEPFIIHGFGIQQSVQAFFQPPILSVPASTSPGSHYLWVEQCGRKVAEFNAYVNELRPWALPSSWYAPAGQKISWNAFMFMPNDRVDLYADGVFTGRSATALSAYAPKHGVNYQGMLAFDVMNYTLPTSLRGKSVLFELRGAAGRVAQTRISVAQ